MLENKSVYCAFKSSFIVEELSNLMGQVLTVVDASTSGEQNIAIKSLIKEKFSNKQNLFTDLQYKQEEQLGEGHRPRNYWEDSLVPYEADKRYSFK